VISIVRRYKSSKLPFDDLVQEGNLGLIRASRDFNPALHGSKFCTYAELWIKSFVHRALIADDSVIRIPGHLYLLRRRYRRAIGALHDRAPMGAAAPAQLTVEEVAEAMGVPPRKLKPSRLAAIQRDSRPRIDQESEALALDEAMADCRRPEEEVVDHEERVLLQSALRQLNPVEAWVLRERYGLYASVPNRDDWSGPRPRDARRVAGERPDLPQNDRSRRGQSCLHRTYAELERDCGLSRHRIHQVETIALERLRGILTQQRRDPERLAKTASSRQKRV
jgi:RNA polymerase primary sigma factor